jgi:transcriptional regulator with XRE-family HTH domain
MEVYEHINTILKQRGLTKRWFAKRLREYEPKLKSTGEIPTEKAIYGYLSGVSSIKIELIPYIAEVLNIDETNLFNPKFSYFHNEEEIISSSNRKYNLKIKNKCTNVNELIPLLEYAPTPMIKKLKCELERIRTFTDEL